MILPQNYTGSKQKSHKIITIIHNIEQGKDQHRKYKRPKLGGSKPMTHQGAKLPSKRRLRKNKA
jgi:hypothetical protein